MPKNVNEMVFVYVHRRFNIKKWNPCLLIAVSPRDTGQKLSPLFHGSGWSPVVTINVLSPLVKSRLANDTFCKVSAFNCPFQANANPSYFEDLKCTKHMSNYCIIINSSLLLSNAFVPSPLYFSTNLQTGICTFLPDRGTPTVSGTNLIVENHNWVVGGIVGQTSFSCYLRHIAAHLSANIKTR